MFNLEDYETVDERIHKFWEKYPNGRIITLDPIIVRGAEGSPLQYVFRCEVYRDASETTPASTGTAEEIVGSSPVNKSAALENAETSAIGRALANLGFSTRGSRPSQTEMAKVQNVQPNARVQDFMEIPLPPSRREVKAPVFEAGEPVRGTDVVIKDPSAAPSEKQTMALVNKSTKAGLNSDFQNEFWNFALTGQMGNKNPITKGDASRLIGMDKTDFEGAAADFMGRLFESPQDEAPF